MNISPAKHPIQISLQTKLILSLLTVVLVSGLGALLVGKVVINQNIVSQAYSEVAQKLEMINDVYANRLYVKQRLITSLASYPEFQRNVNAGRRLQIFDAVQGLKEPSFDILNVTDSQGRVLVRSRNFHEWGDSVADDKYVRAVLKDQRAAFGFDVMDSVALGKESPALAAQAIVPLKSVEPLMAGQESTNHRDLQAEVRGMVLKVAVPIWHDGKFIGVIYGALLLNNDTSILDRARTLMLGEELIKGREVASVTVFMNGLRISTSVRDENGQRALGTSVSPEVYKKVFEEGQIWKDRALVVGHWAIAAYKPIKDIEGKTIGILYTGLLEEKFAQINKNTNSSFIFIIVISGLLSLFLSAYLVHHFIRPINALVDAAQGVAAGNYHKVQIKTKDEMGYLSIVFNTMVDALVEKDRILMESVEKRIERTEKLAILGRLSSGVAHEINNPLTGVLAFTDILLESLAGTEHEEDLKVIKMETLRCREIVRGMLDFARETTLEKVPANLNKIINEVLVILRNHVSFQNVTIERKLDPSIPDVLVDINQIKSVFSNLIVNAADAMPTGGTLTITSQKTQDGKFVSVQVIDTGTGIPEENLLKVFDPFFTTKETGKGTGLGLSVTYGIVKRHNGFINIKSKEGVGTRIDIQLPLNPEEQSNE